MIFQSSEEVEQVLGGFFERIGSDPTMGPRLLASKLVIRFRYQEPEVSITVDLTGPRIDITYNDTAKVPTVEMTMKADVAHAYWLGKITLPIALARRQIVAKGPIPKILKLLPILKQSHALYPRYLAERHPRLCG
ncbi:MAG: hypothetical protein HY543_06435 [Deltaproteobacteria bacterium]|nr:hypothetical protein [Deltaproteobacteria bacterium]